MPYITREDGERFIIPSYRDILSAKKASLLKKEIVLLSSNYGEYITLQRKNANQFEIAFSPDPGYLLGECVWHFFKRPYDMIYCEKIPNSNEAILVIVKSGSVYLDGSFPVDSIPEELVIFKTQQNNFSIFIEGDVPISEHPEEGKFSFDPSSVRSFQVLDAPVFPTLPGIKAFQLQLVDTVLKSHGIGILPIKQIAIVMALVFIGWLGYSYLSTHQKEIPIVIMTPTNPFQNYQSQLVTPDPATEITTLNNMINFLYTIPGWSPTDIIYTPGVPARIFVRVVSKGARLKVLQDWAGKYHERLDILPNGVFVTIMAYSAKRNEPTTISSLTDLIASMLDRLSYVLPGNNMTFTAIADKKSYSETTVKIAFNDLSPFAFDLIGKSIADLPLVLLGINITMSGTGMSGTITLKALGN